MSHDTIAGDARYNRAGRPGRIERGERRAVIQKAMRSTTGAQIVPYDVPARDARDGNRRWSWGPRRIEKGVGRRQAVVQVTMRVACSVNVITDDIAAGNA